MTLILGFETSCDETAAAVVADGRIVRSNVVASQHALHQRYRGVVPEIASRAHLEALIPVVHDALHQARATLDQIDAIGVGNRPGLIGSLLVGVSAAKALAWALRKPLIGIDHVQAHLYAAFLCDNAAAAEHPWVLETHYPALGLVVSGGHTSLYQLNAPTQLERIGRTIDDAVGEAYDKAAVILELPYPGGPNLDRLARTGSVAGEPLPRSLLTADSLDFSFSGLKTALLYRVRGTPRGRGSEAVFERSAADLTPMEKANLAAAFQEAAVDAVIIKLNRAIERMTRDAKPPRSLIVGGGVSANSRLRERVLELGQLRSIPILLPAMPYCVDNAAMIAGLGYQLHILGQHDGLDLPALATPSR